MAEIYVTVASGQTVSGAFALEHPYRPLVILVPSLAAAAEVRPQFSATSGSGFMSMMRPDGSANLFVVCSGAGPGIGIIEHVPSQWGRFSLTGVQTDVRTLTLFPGASR
jgi:hypothetical protein